MRTSEAAYRAIRACLEGEGAQGHLLGLGSVAQLERKLEAHYGVRHALCVSNATTGLLAVAQALELKNTSFITTPYTYGASVAGWLSLGNKPVFADVEAETMTLDPEAVKRALAPEVEAILAVDLFGNPSDTVGLRRIADEYGLWYIADAAQSFGASRDGMPASRLADAMVLSFTVGKPLDVGEGGAILTDHDWLRDRLLWLTQHPGRMVRELGLHHANEFGMNARIHPLAAAWANAVFDDALSDIAARQERCLGIVDVLNASGLVEPLHYRQDGMLPSFFRLSAAWRTCDRSATLTKLLEQHCSKTQIVPSPVRLIYQQGAFLAQFGSSWRSAGCAVAELHASKRFCVVDRSSSPLIGDSVTSEES